MEKRVSEIIWEMRKWASPIEDKILTDAYDQITNNGLGSFDLETIEDALCIVEQGWHDVTVSDSLRRAWEVLHAQRQVLRAWEDYGCKAS